MSIRLPGSTWEKWDLHVHTPESFIHHDPGDKEAAWEAFLSDLEHLPDDFKVIGINDYVLVDGYERVLKAKREQGRLQNIDLILPVVELRLDKFGGVVHGRKDGYSRSGWSWINVHVIFGGQLRIVDEPGEDYLHPQELFVTVELPRSVQRRALQTAGLASRSIGRADTLRISAIVTDRFG